MTGHVTGKLGSMQALTVNGVNVLPLAQNRTFTTTVTFDPGFVIFGIEAELTRLNGTKDRARITAMSRSSYPDELQEIINRGPAALNPSLGAGGEAAAQQRS